MANQGNHLASRYSGSRSRLFGRPRTARIGRQALRAGPFHLALFIVIVALAFLPAAVAATDYPDLTVSFLQANVGGATAGSVFTYSVNPVTATVKNTGTAAASASVLRVQSSDGFLGTGSIPALAAGGTASVTVIDTMIRTTDSTISYTATADSTNLITESDESNNAYTRSGLTVNFNGYKGQRLYRGESDIVTKKTYDINGDIVYSFGNSFYRSGSFGGSWTEYDVKWGYNATPLACDIAIPSGATVKAARLYLPYTWDYPNPSRDLPDKSSIKFNGIELNGSGQTYQQTYQWDQGNFGQWGEYRYGLLSYDVTTLYQKNVVNSLHFVRPGTNDKLSLYGMTLLVVYEEGSASHKQIFLNEGFDLLGADPTNYKATEAEAVAYVPFTGLTIDTTKVKTANLITFVPSGEGPEGNLLLGDGTVVATNVWNYGADDQPVGEDGSPQVAVDVRDVKSYLGASGNVFAIQSTARTSQPCMAAAQQFLVVEYYKAPVAGFAANTITPIVGQIVAFTDQSTNNPTTWAWTFGDGTTSTAQNPTHAYTATGTFSVTLTATNSGGSNTVTKTNYITVSSAAALVPLPGYTNLPTDPDSDGLYEDLNANGAKDLNDVVLFFKYITWIASNEPVSAFDFNGNGSIDLNDVVRLFKEMV